MCQFSICRANGIRHISLSVAFTHKCGHVWVKTTSTFNFTDAVVVEIGDYDVRTIVYLHEILNNVEISKMAWPISKCCFTFFPCSKKV